MEIIFLLVGLIFCSIGALIIFFDRRFREDAEPIPGRIIGFSKGQGNRETSYHSVAEFVGIDGRRRYVESAIGSSNPIGRIGDPITILTHLDNPDQASIQSSMIWVFGALFIALGLGACAVFFSMFKYDKVSIASALLVITFLITRAGMKWGGKPIPWQTLKDFKEKALGVKVFTDETKGQILWADPAEIDSAFRRQRKAGWIMGPILMLIGLGLLFLGQNLHRMNEAFLATAERTSGRVVSLKTNHSNRDWSYSAVVEFEGRGRKFTFTDSIGSNHPLFTVGEEVKVLFDPADPDHARIDRGIWNRLLPWGTGILGLLLLLAGLQVLRSVMASGRSSQLYSNG